MTKLLQQCLLFFIVVVILGHNLGHSQVSVNRTIGPTLVYCFVCLFVVVFLLFATVVVILLFLRGGRGGGCAALVSFSNVSYIFAVI